MLQRSLFETALPTTANPNWRPPEPPSLDGVNEIILDCETTGLRWWADDLPIGIAIGWRDGRARYLPFRHAGGNLNEETMKRWARRELRDKLIYLFNGPFDINMMYMWGTDLEAQGCTVSDIGNYAALLDDHRASSTLDSIARDHLGVGKVQGIDTTRMAEYHAADVTPYAETDVVLVNELRDKFWPMLDAEDLQRARKLEDDCIFVTCEMMRNGAPLDVEKLDAWVAKSEQDYYACLWEIHQLTGLKINPRSHPDQIKLFENCKLPPPTVGGFGEDREKITFKKEKLAEINHPVIKILYHTKRLASLRSKYLVKYQDEIKKHGRLIYSLHQVPIDNEGGVRFGRYSSSGFGTDPPEGINVQQVAGKKQQASVKGDEDLEGYVIRELFVPESGLWLSGDASQIEFRLFAHYGKPPRVLEAYKKDQWTNFHSVVQEMIQEIKEISYELTKDCNFAEIYGAQLPKVAEMIGMTQDQARPFDKAYHKAFPEVRATFNRAMKLAEDRGFVRTLLGRRARFPSWGDPTYAALNRVIQGSAAEENKIKLVELHKARHETGFKLRFTVHDEADGDVPDVEAAKKVEEILNRQILPTIVPLLWEVNTGPNWKACE